MSWSDNPYVISGPEYNLCFAENKNPGLSDELKNTEMFSLRF